MLESLEQSPESDEAPAAVSRSRFLAYLGLGLGATAGGIAGTLLSPLRALAAPRNALSISSSMPVVSKIGLFLGSVSSLKANSALAYTDPKTGDPALVIRLPNGQLKSYDVVCPHRGCTVGYDTARNTLICPCHGARFDPANNAAPLGGPVSQPLISLPIRVDATGNVYALDSKPGSKVNRLHAAPAFTGEDDGGAGDDGAGGSSPKKRRHHHHHGDN